MIYVTKQPDLCKEAGERPALEITEEMVEAAAAEFVCRPNLGEEPLWEINRVVRIALGAALAARTPR